MCGISDDSDKSQIRSQSLGEVLEKRGQLRLGQVTFHCSAQHLIHLFYAFIMVHHVFFVFDVSMVSCHVVALFPLSQNTIFPSISISEGMCHCILLSCLALSHLTWLGSQSIASLSLSSLCVVCPKKLYFLSHLSQKILLIGSINKFGP